MDGTTTRTIGRWGTGALNIETSRVHGHWPTHLTLTHTACTESNCASDCPAALADSGGGGQLASRLFFQAKASKSTHAAHSRASK
jgi:hypothetical protein